MKSSDEIKKAMLHCSPVSCRSDGCPYRDDTPKYEGDMPVCRMKLWHDMGCLIQQLQAENAEQAERIRVLESRNNALYYTILGVMHFVDKWLDVPAYDPDEDLNGTTAIGRASQAREITLQAIEQLEAEWDAAVAGLKSNCSCPECKYFSDDIQEPCRGCKPTDSKFEWRGVQKEDSDA